MPKLNIDLTVTDQGSAVIKTFGNNVLQMATGFTAGQLAITAITEAARLFKEELFGGLRAVEDYNLSIATMTSFITSFSQKTAEGDLAGGFKEANEYAQQLIPTLEIMDAKTIATGRELTIMAETMAMNGVLLDVNNQKQQAGFLAIATSLKMITAGQNQDIQMRQEINALLQGQIRATDRLPKLLQAMDPYLADHLKQWKAEGTLIENVGELLKGVTLSGDLITQTWAAIGSSMDTIHTRILRGGMVPAYEDLLQLAEDTNRAFMDQDGNLTELGQTIQGVIAAGWLDIKNTLQIIWHIFGDGSGLKTLAELTGVIFEGWGKILAILEPLTGWIAKIGNAIRETILSALSLASGDLAGAKAHWAENGRLMGEVMATNLRDEFYDSLVEYDAAKNIGKKAKTGPVSAPALTAAASKEAQEEAGKQAAEVLKIEHDLTDKINKMTMGKYAYKKWALDQEVIDLQFKANSEQAWLQAVQFGTVKTLELMQEQAETDKKLLGKKLTEYQKFYAEVGKRIKDNFELEKEAIKAISGLLQQQSGTRKSTEGMLVDLGGAKRSDLDQYNLTRGELAQQLEIANQLTGQDKIKALEDYKQGLHAIALEYQNGIGGSRMSGGIKGETILADVRAAIQAAYEQQKTAMEEQRTAMDAQIENSRKWGEVLSASAVEANNYIVYLQNTLVELDETIAAMDKAFTVAAEDNASATIKYIQNLLDDLQSKTITITTRHVSIGGGGATPVLDSHALGTGYIPKTGPYELHYGESVNTAAETRALSAGGGAFKLAAGGNDGGFVVQGDVNFHLPAPRPGAALPTGPELDRWVRDEAVPALRRARFV